MSVPVGELACQKDSFKRSFSSVVISCEKISTQSKKSDGNTHYDVVLQDTILFPEGGGQPCDFGTIDGIQVISVRRENLSCVHQLAGAVEVGKTVDIQLDWDRRLDNMQQHSGQHLITAVADNELGCPTLSWHLGDLQTTYIDIGNAKLLTPEKIQLLENRVNELISHSTAVNTHTFEDVNKLKTVFPDVRSRGLPTDWTGSCRMVEIHNVDINMCCGTHVTNLAQLQMVKLLNLELKGEKGKLFFVCGNRVAKLFQLMYNNTQAMTRLLSTNMDQHVPTVDTLKTNYSKLLKMHKTTSTELADLTAKQLLDGVTAEHRETALLYNRENVGMDFLNAIFNAFKEHMPEVVVILTCVEGPNVQFVVGGPQEKVSEIGPRVATVLGGKGGGKGKFQGKAKDPANIQKLASIFDAKQQ